MDKHKCRNSGSGGRKLGKNGMKYWLGNKELRNW